MRHIGILPLGLVLCVSCLGFVDSGPSSNAATAGVSTTMSDGVDTSTSTSAVSSGPATSSPATSGSTALGSTTFDAPACEEAPECTPGTAEAGGACGDCSVERRVCGDDCSWGAWSCVVDEDACAVWVLPSGAQEWTAHPIELNGVVQFTPDDPIQAAFNLELSNKAYVLTEQEFHTLDLETLTWSGRGDREDLFQEAGEQNLEGATSMNIGLSLGGSPTSAEQIVLYSDEDFWRFEFEPGGLPAAFLEEGPCCVSDEDWQGSFAPNPSDIRGIWLDLVGNPAWNPISLIDCAPLENGSPLTRYSGFLVTDDTVRVREYTTCGDFVGAYDYSQYTPFALPIAPPPPPSLGAALLHDDALYVFIADV